ncbi:MAG: PilZ domain-containing protein [Myxococcales bacterium]|nr:PilZ domain-containing protein [Myxococcales bacterium]
MASKKAATALVLGDPGPARDELLLRGEIDVIWSASLDDTLEILKVYTIDACIVSSHYQPFLTDVRFLQATEKVPVLLWSDGSSDVESVMRFLANSTGLLFVRYPRAPICLPVTIGVHGEQFHLETINLSVSGMAVNHFPALAPGTRAELCLELPDYPVYLLARVVRVFESEEGRQAGLSFTDLGESLRATLANLVEEFLPTKVDDPSFIGDWCLSVPLPRRVIDGDAQGVDREPGVACGAAEEIESFMTLSGDDDLSAPSMRLIDEESAMSVDVMPEWFEYLHHEMSAPEKLAACGKDAPNWAHEVLRFRISLARARATLPTRDVPPTMVDEAYQMFSGIEQETMDAPYEVREQVSSLRASLLRDILD